MKNKIGMVQPLNQLLNALSNIRIMVHNRITLAPAGIIKKEISLKIPSIKKEMDKVISKIDAFKWFCRNTF